jgi:peptide/nickel transport system permease protein
MTLASTTPGVLRPGNTPREQKARRLRKILGGVGVRLVQVVPTLILASVIIFSLQMLIPGDAATALAGDDASASTIEALREQLGLNQPVWVQFWNWFSNLLQGNLGTSAVTGVSVNQIMAERLPVTLMITAASMVVMAVVGIPLGIVAALRRNTKVDAFVTGLSTLGLAIPSFWLGMVLILVFSISLGMFPAIGFVSPFEDPVEGLRSLALPAVALGFTGAAEAAQQTRSAMIEVLDSDAMRTHRAKGLSGASIVFRHALKNAGIPIVTIMGLRLSEVIGGSVVIETLFALPGIGSVVMLAITQRDFVIVQAVVLITVLLVMVTNLLVDLIYLVVDPRMSSGKG